MFLGQDFLFKRFKELADTNKLGSAYLFFGESGLGKFSFAKSLAAYLETGDWNFTASLIDCLILMPPLGIDEARKVKNFLWQKPFRSPRRTVVIGRAENLTPEAQNALLKIIEEPPRSSLILLTASESSLLAPTINSRINKIYFPRLQTKLIVDFLQNEFNLNPGKAKTAAERSFGCPGRAVEIIKKKEKEPEESLEQFIENQLLLLRSDLKRNSAKLAWLLDRYVLIKRHNLNMPLQKKAIVNFLWKK
ncbi:MAG: hypothetical protein HYW34_02520 [Candidatus Brennerbacteria bacterium]|nr:hypothetical protein [Candidatus Brennerbacteria bacterium]